MRDVVIDQNERKARSADTPTVERKTVEFVIAETAALGESLEVCWRIRPARSSPVRVSRHGRSISA